MKNNIDEMIHSWGSRYFRSYSWDGKEFIAIGRTGITHSYDAEYVIGRFQKKLDAR